MDKHLFLPCYGYIHLPKYVFKIIDHPYFQRLRYIKQLGLCCHVYPGATHTRFEHCLGTAWLAQTVVNTLKEKQPELNITERNKLCIIIAALIHDIGHGPLSHCFDNRIISQIPEKKRPCKGNTHEERIGPLFNKIAEDTCIDLSQEEIDLIIQIVNPNKKDRNWMLDIVANPRHGFDVDKADYICRDSYHIGRNDWSCNPQYLFAHVKVIDNELCYPEFMNFDIYRLYQTRYCLFRDIYTHKKVCAIELSISNHFDAMQYTKLDWTQWTDDIFRNVIHRYNYTCIHDEILPTGITKDSPVVTDMIDTAISKISSTDQTNIIKDIYTIGFVSGSASHPLLCISFYNNHNQKFRLALAQYSTLISSHYQETGFRLYKQIVVDLCEEECN